jgi:hypothetical protein
MIAAELKAANPAINIEILGVNKHDRAAYNANIAPYHLPWLQDTVTNSVWGTWHVLWRDVWVLDAQNRLYTVYNLSDHDLTDPANREFLKQLFREAATFVDVDADGLFDDWEMLNFGNLSATPAGDADGDTQNNFSEYAFGTSPNDIDSKTSFRANVEVAGTNRYFHVSFRRRAGSAVTYALETSSDLITWSAASNTVTILEPFKNLFDGTGTGQTTCKLTVPIESQARAFLRVRAAPQGTESLSP